MRLKDCFNPKILITLAIIAGAAFFVLPKTSFAAVVPVLAVLLCPLSMFLAMKMTGNKPRSTIAEFEHTSPNKNLNAK